MACILVVDKDDRFRVDLCTRLTHAGYLAVAAASGLEATSLLLRYHPDVVISEVVMPEMDGIELIRYIKKQSLIPWIIALHEETKDGGYSYLKMAERTGADFTVAKPCDVDALTALVGNVLKQAPKHSSSLT